MGVYKENDKSYTGAGVMVVEDYWKNGKIIPTILVARNKASQICSDFGGSYENKHLILAETASKELLEESRNLIKVKPEILQKSKKVDIDGYRNTYYRAYIIKVHNISTKYYEHNKKIINSSESSKRQWKETDRIYHIPISNIKFESLLDRKKVIIKDVNNEEVVLGMRLRKLLKRGEGLIHNVLSEDPIMTKKDLRKINKSEYSFLIDTYQFKAKD